MFCTAGYAQRTVEFHNMDSGTAVSGPNLPTKVWSGPTLVNVKETVYMIGGSVKDVFRLRNDLSGWDTLPVQLPIEHKYSHCAVHFTWT